MSEIHKIDSRLRTTSKSPTRTEKALSAVRENNGPGSREHGPVPPKKPNYLARRAGVLAVGVTGIAAGAGLLSDGNSKAENNPPTTTVVVAEAGDTVWGLQRAEATASGVHPDADIRSTMDQAVELNGGTRIQPNQAVILIDVNPEKPNK